ncbi:MAG: DEAD/DEAH box helicase [Lentisphaerae bacterium]|nr:DEAD/DEAH box helicase [Lentisphaerota bacterium]
MFIGSVDDPATAFDPDEFAVDYELSGYGCCEIDLENACREFFAPGGTLAQAAAINGNPSEERPQQLEMALAIARALQEHRNVCIEAPTGVGKSFAYLLPLIHYAVNSRRPALVSTETINLQHQLIEKDLPFLRELTGIEFRVALAKGRSNYLCRRRLALLSGDQRDMLLPSAGMVLETERLIADLESGNDEAFTAGVRPASQIWHLVCCESGNCMGPKCEFYRNCFYFKARRKWDEADIVVANHALFLTDLQIRRESGNGSTLLPDYGAVMIDEAHTLENNAAVHLGLRLTRAGAVSVMNRLYNGERAKGLLMRPGSEMLELRAMVSRCRDEFYGFFASYAELLRKSDSNSVRLDEKQPDLHPDVLVSLLQKISSALEAIADDEENDAVRVELLSYSSKCLSFADAIDTFTLRRMDDAVYYVESEQSDSITCSASPLNVAQLLEELLFNSDPPALMCSATMTVSGKFDYFISRIGFTGGDVLKLDSPFSPDQANLWLTDRMPEPSSPEYLPQLAENIRQLVVDNNGSAFVLFTSYQSMKFCRSALQEQFNIHGLPLLVQGEGLSRAEMLRSFQTTPHSVLFGTDSFWTGVDVPGENLTLVIITRLPFASIGSPLTSARMEKIEASGKSSFTHYSLPEAVLKFRQGAGRLIRTRNDHGTIAVLDSRILTRRYGKEFLNSLLLFTRKEVRQEK